MLLIMSFKTKYQIHRTSKHIMSKTMINKRCPRRTFTHITGSNRETGWLLNTHKKLCFGGYKFPVFSELTDTHLHVFHGKQINLSKTALIHERIRNNL